METKPGYLTTEFWTTVVLVILGVIQQATGAIDVNNKWVVLGMAIVAGLYNGSRGLAKTGVPYTADKTLPTADSPPVVSPDLISPVTPKATSTVETPSTPPDVK